MVWQSAYYLTWIVAYIVIKQVVVIMCLYHASENMKRRFDPLVRAHNAQDGRQVLSLKWQRPRQCQRSFHQSFERLSPKDWKNLQELQRYPTACHFGDEKAITKGNERTSLLLPRSPSWWTLTDISRSEIETSSVILQSKGQHADEVGIVSVCGISVIFGCFPAISRQLEKWGHRWDVSGFA